MTRFFKRGEFYLFRPLVTQLSEAGQQLSSTDAFRHQGGVDDAAILDQGAWLAADQMADCR